MSTSHRSVITLLAIAASIATLGVVAAETRGQTNTGPFVVGIVEIPSVFAGDADPRPPSRPVPIYRDRVGSPTLATVVAPADIEALEYGYELEGAVVYELAADAFRIRLADGRYGWLHATDAGAFHSLISLYIDSLTHMTERWDGQIYGRPANSSTASRRATLPLRKDHVPVNVIEGREDEEGRLWVYVEVMSSVCDAEEPKVLDRGWVRAHNATGQLNVWFYSRGC